ncbi:MAG: dihydrofolate reductase [Bacteroidota bacterium]
MKENPERSASARRSSLVPRRSPEIVIVAALAEANRVIGDGQNLPWHIPEDLKHFKRLTLGHPLVMGRKTFESVLHQFGRPLPGRENVVLTRHPMRVDHAGIHVYSSLDAALDAFGDREKICIGGGATIYEQTLPLADRLELTFVEGDYDGDTFFPPVEHLLGTEFELSGREPHDGFRFETWVRA